MEHFSPTDRKAVTEPDALESTVGSYLVPTQNGNFALLNFYSK